MVTLYYTMLGVIMLIVCTFGLFGNIAAIITFRKPHRLQRNFYTFMFYLAIFDLLYIVVATLVFILPQLSDYYKNEGSWHYIVPWAIPIGQVSMSGSVFFTTVIAIERYLTVCHPFYMFSRNWSSKIIGMGIISFSILYNIPKFLETSTSYELCYFNKSCSMDVQTLTYSSRSCHHEFYSRNMNEGYILLGNEYNSKNFTNHIIDTPIISDDSVVFYRYEVIPSNMRLNSVYVQVYAVYLNLVINGIVPFALVIVLNILILKELQNLGHASSPVTQPQGNQLV